MSDQSNYFQHLKKFLESSKGRVLLSSVLIASSSAKLLDRKILAEKLLDRILPLYGISGELTKYYGLQAIYEGINLLNPQYCRRDEALRMLSKCHGMSSQQQEQLAGAVKVFMEIVYKTKLNSIQLNTLEIWDHVIVGDNEYTNFADSGLL